MTRNRRGFTLMEMLIAITVLVMLSGVTLFSTLDFVTTAEADKIINNLIQLKTATLMWYKENSSRVEYSGNEYKIKTDGVLLTFDNFVKDHKSEILKYISNAKSIELFDSQGSIQLDNYVLVAVENDGRKWYVCCYLDQYSKTGRGEEAPDTRVREKIAGRAKKFGLSGIASAKKHDIPKGDYSGQRYVCMKILELSKR